jgi:hypothetical protein
MEEQDRKEASSCACGCEGCTCDCDCDCCQKAKGQPKEHAVSESTGGFVKMNDTVGASFLGILAVMLLIFLVRSNKRNRELLLEVTQMRRQA